MPDPVRIRASSLGELFDCPARWCAKHLLKRRLPASCAAWLGRAVHAGTALYDQSGIEGAGLSVEDCAGAVVDALRKPEEEVDWEEESPASLEKLALPLHRLYCEKVAPAQEYVAVEALCEDLTLTDLGISLTGTVDRVRRTEEGLGIADIKTGKTAVAADGTVNTRGHAAQLGVYEILATAALGLPMRAPAQIIGLQVARSERGRRAGTAEIGLAREALLDDEQGPGLLRHAARLVHAGDFYGNPRSLLCNPKYCPAYADCRWR